MNSRARAIAQLQMPGDEIGMKVRQEDMPNLEVHQSGIVQILLDVALRIDDDRGPAWFIAKQVRRVCEATEVVLFEDHSNPSGRFSAGGNAASIRPTSSKSASVTSREKYFKRYMRSVVSR